MAQDKVGRATVWIAIVGSVVIALTMTIGFCSGSPTHLNFLISLIFLNPLIFAVGSGIAFWRTEGLGPTAAVFGTYLLTFALVWQVATNWYTFSWRDSGAGFVSIGLAAVGYLVVSALVILVLFLVRPANQD